MAYINGGNLTCQIFGILDEFCVAMNLLMLATLILFVILTLQMMYWLLSGYLKYNAWVYKQKWLANVNNP